MRLRAMAILAAAASMTGVTPGQEAGSGRVVIRTEARVVLVDAVVTDNKGNYVSDLTAKDFRVWEDNKEQTITSVGSQADGAARTQRREGLILLFDTFSMGGSNYARAKQAAARMLEMEGAAGRMTAVAAFTGSIRIIRNFTTDAEQLKQAVARIPQARGAGPGGQDFLSALADLARGVRTVPGRKTLVLFSDGSGLAIRWDKTIVRAAMNACYRANLVIYPVDVRGVEATQQYYFQGPMMTLADHTGGFVSGNSNDLLKGLLKIVKEEHAYYQLGYTPPESSRDNCHALRVVVSRRGTKVRSRNSYCFTKPVDILAGTPAERELQGRLAGSEAGAAAASMQAPFFYSAPDTARVNLALEIPSGGIRFEKAKGKLHAEVNVLAMAYRDDRVAARSSDVVKLDFDDQAAVDAFKQKPLHYENQFEIAPGKYNLKVAFGQTGGVFGKLESALAIDAYDGQRFGTSALTLSRQVRQAQDASGVDTALMEERTPLVARDLEYIPSGENRFPQGERFRIYFELYDPQLLTGASSVTARIATFDKKTGRSMSALDLGNVSENARPGTNTIPIGITMPALPPGSYRTELQAASVGAGSAARSVEFDVY